MGAGDSQPVNRGRSKTCDGGARPPSCHHLGLRPGRESYPNFWGLNALIHQREDRSHAHTQFQDKTMVAAAWGLGNVSSGREGCWGEKRSVLGVCRRPQVYKGWGCRGEGAVGAAMPGLGPGPGQTWLPPSLAGTNAPTPKGSPPGGGSSSSRSSNRVRGAGAGATMAGRTVGRTNGRSEALGSPCSHSPRDPRGHPLLRHAPAGSGNPAREEEEEGGRGGGGEAGARSAPAPGAPRPRENSGRPRVRPALRVLRPCAPRGPPRGRAPTLELLLCAPGADAAPPRASGSSGARRILSLLQQLPEGQVRGCDSAQDRPGRAAGAQQPMWVLFRESSPEASRDPSPEHTTSPRPRGGASITVVIQPPKPSGLGAGPGRARPRG